MTREITILSNDPAIIGTTQRTRLMNDANPMEIEIDGRTTEQLISMTSHIAALYKLTGVQGVESGSWPEFFNRNITVVISEFLSHDFFKHQIAFNNCVKNYGSAVNIEKKFTFLREMSQNLYDQIVRIRLLRDKLLKMQYPGGNIEKYSFFDIDAYFQQDLMYYIQDLVAISNGALTLAKKHKTDFDVGVSIIEDFEGDTVEPSLIPSELEAVYLRLRLLNNKLNDTNQAIKGNLKPYLELSLNEKNDHEPSLGLFFAFLEQYKKLQKLINKLPEKYLHLYYIEFLKQKKRAHIPPYVYIYFLLSPYVESTTIPAGTVCMGPPDENGLTHRFSTVYDVNVSHCQLEDIKTIYFDRGYRETVTNKYAIVTESFMAPIAHSQDGVGTAFNPDKPPVWPTFGEQQLDKEPHLRNMIDTSLGFSVSAPVLHLNEGNRTVNVRLQFEPGSVRELEKLFADIATKEDKRTSKSDIFYKIFSTRGKKRNISIYLTGGRGWFRVDPQTVKIFQENEEWDPGHICFSFHLDAKAPAIIPYEENLHAGKFVVSDQPSMVVLLNNEREPYLYSFLQKLIIKEINIDVKVSNLRNLVLANETGPIDISQPFYPFGPTPGRNSYLMLGSAEIFRKQISALSMEIEWFDLPETPGDFNKKYVDYDIKLKDFFIRLANLSEGRFKVEENARRLFEAEKTEGTDRRQDEHIFTKIALTKEDLKNLNFEPNPGLTENLVYTNNLNSGYMKIILDEPEIGFGGEKYQEVLSKYMLKNARLLNKSFTSDTDDEQALYFPPMPEAPMVSAVTINYEARETIDFRADEAVGQSVHHIHPFGNELIYPSLKFSDNLPFILPQYEDDGYLLFGLTNTRKTEIVSFLIQMMPVYFQDKDQYTTPQIKWEYLSFNNNWKKLPGEYLLRDETDNFTKSGIVQIKIPADISNRSQVMETGKFWIRVCATGDLLLLNHTIGIFVNATLVKWMDITSPVGLDAPFPPESISNLASKVPGITAVKQPYESFGGKGGETFIEFYTRVSERIRHKNRGWTKWDIERIILNKFPEIDQVFCISGLSDLRPTTYEYLNLEADNEIVEINYRSNLPEFTSNKVIVVVVPRKMEYIKGYISVANYKMLEKIKHFMMNHTSPFVDIKVRNPEFEYLRIQCDIKFAEAGNEGHDIAVLKQEIVQFICPWLMDHANPLAFNKELNIETLKDYLKSLEFVVFITKFSIIQIIEDGFMYHLIDSADFSGSTVLMRPTKPWAAFLPLDDHYINIVQDEYETPPQKVQAPVGFKNEYNILKKTKIIQIKTQTQMPVKESKKHKNKQFKPFSIDL